jgi:hypothetical protein
LVRTGAAYKSRLAALDRAYPKLSDAAPVINDENPDGEFITFSSETYGPEGQGNGVVSQERGSQAADFLGFLKTTTSASVSLRFQG